MGKGIRRLFLKNFEKKEPTQEEQKKTPEPEKMTAY
jgi:hypothetical protein